MQITINRLTAAGTALLSLATGLGAVVISSCCALPLALSVAGLGGAWLGGANELIAYRPHALMAAALALAIGWGVALRRRAAACPADGACARPARGWLTFGTLGLSTLLVGVAAAWGWIEPAVIAALIRLTGVTA